MRKNQDKMLIVAGSMFFISMLILIVEMIIDVY